MFHIFHKWSKIVSDHCECEICLSVRKAGMGGGE
jgi:hypothetical protein